MGVILPKIPQIPQNLSAQAQKFGISIKMTSLGELGLWSEIRSLSQKLAFPHFNLNQVSQQI